MSSMITEGALATRWYVVPDDLAGGAAVATVDKPVSTLQPEQGEVCVALVPDAVVALHIVELHNRELEPAYQGCLLWKPDQSRTSNVLPPLPPEHPMYYEPCPACRRALGDGTSVQLLATGPTGEADWEAHRENRQYSAHALVFHAACLGTAVDE